MTVLNMTLACMGLTEVWYLSLFSLSTYKGGWVCSAQFSLGGDVTFRNLQYILAVLNYMHHKNSILLIPLSVFDCCKLYAYKYCHVEIFFSLLQDSV